MWEVNKPEPVKLIIGILAADERCLAVAAEAVTAQFGKADLESEIWPFDQTEYYKDQTGENIVKQFICIDKLIDPGELATIKLKANEIEQDLAQKLNTDLPRPINLDPGIIEPSKLVLASTKNFSHRIYIGQKIYAEVTLTYQKGNWHTYDYTFPDHKLPRYHAFFSKVRERLVEQLKKTRN